MRIVSFGHSSVLMAGLFLFSFTVPVCAEVSAPLSTLDLPDAPTPQTTEPAQQNIGTAPSGSNQDVGRSPAAKPTQRTPAPQPTRILGIMPNYRAVSAGTIPPPPSPRNAFRIATQNSFDYSSYAFVGLTSLLAEGTNAHPQLGKGAAGYWGYFWRGFADKTDGNYWVIWALPSVLHQDERYFAKGEGPILHRSVYAATRILVARDYHGRNIFNTSEVLGRGISQSISLSYYPSKDQSLGPFLQKYGYALGRDALTNTFREVWPDINQHLFHHQP